MSITNRLKKHWYNLLTPHCHFCGHKHCLDNLSICEACYQDLPWMDKTTNTCVNHCHLTLSAFYYHAPISSLLLKVKFGKDLQEISVLAELVSHSLLSQMESIPEAILPIPLHPIRLRKRGFNQALELAKPLAKKLGIPLLSNTVIRQKYTQPQTELHALERNINLTDAFQLATHLPYKHIALFDDVITTGATCSSLAQTLQQAGIETIEAWSCARPAFQAH